MGKNKRKDIFIVLYIILLLGSTIVVFIACLGYAVELKNHYWQAMSIVLSGMVILAHVLTFIKDMLERAYPLKEDDTE